MQISDLWRKLWRLGKCPTIRNQKPLPKWLKCEALEDRVVPTSTIFGFIDESTLPFGSAGSTLVGNTSGYPLVSKVDSNGWIVLTPAEQNLYGSLIVNHPGNAAGYAIRSFQMDAQMTIHRGQSPFPGDGYSIGYGPLSGGFFGETGDTNGGLWLSVNSYRANGDDHGIDLIFNHNVIASWTLNYSQLQVHSAFVSLRVTGTGPSTASVSFHHPAIGWQSRNISGWNPSSAWKFGYGARTGNSADGHVIESTHIYDTTSIPNVTLSGSSGTVTDATAPSLGWTVTDADGDPLTVSAKVTRDGSVVNGPSPAHDGTFTPSRDLGLGTYDLTVTVTDHMRQARNYTRSYTLVDNDTTAPTIGLSLPSSGTLSSGKTHNELSALNQTFTWNITDASDSTSTVTIHRGSDVIYTKNYTSNVSSDSFDFNSFGTGTYTLSITATDKDNHRSGDSLTSTFSYIVNVLNSPPTTDFVTTIGTEGSLTRFDASPTFDVDGDTVTEYVWNLGDGTLARGKMIEHSYRDNGEYLVTLTAVSTGGSDVGVKSSKVLIPNVAPTLKSIAPTKVAEMQPLVLTLDITDPGADTTSILVNWGNGKTATYSIGDSIQHVYTRGGQQHTIRVSLQDEDGSYADLFVQNVDVQNAPPMVTGLLPSYSARPGIGIDFGVNVVDGEGDTFTYTWDFGNGKTLTGSNLDTVNYAYAKDGTYDVTVIVGDSDGFFTTAKTRVSVGIPVSFTLGEQSITEQGGFVTITARLDDGKTLPYHVLVPLTVSGGSSSDYSVSEQTILIPAGQLVGSTKLLILDDNLNEENEVLTVLMGLPTPASRGPISSQRITIIDNDAPPAVFFITPSQTVEESAGKITITASLTKISGRDVIIPLGFSGIANHGSDYTAPTEILIPAGQLTGSGIVRIIDDSSAELAESLIVQMLPSAQAFGSKAAGQPTSVSFIIAASDVPSVSLDSAYRLTAEGVGEVFIRVRPSRFHDEMIRVPFTLSGNVPRIATRDLDYVILQDEFIILPGADEAVLRVQITDDDLVEGTENFIITLGQPTNATLGVSQWVLTDILDNDRVRVSFDAGDITRFEDEQSVKVRVTLSNPSQYETTKVNLVLTGTANLTHDYTISSKVVSFAPNQTEQWVTFTILNDSTNEPTENIFLSLGTITMSDGGDAIAGDIATKKINIRDNDPLVTIRSDIRWIRENETKILFTVELSATTNREVVVPILYSGNATPNIDYKTQQHVRIPTNLKSATFSLPLIDDREVESNEHIIVLLGRPSNALLGNDRTISITMIDDDVPLPIVSWDNSSFTVIEDQGEAEIQVSLTERPRFPVTVNFSYSDQEAKVGKDYISEIVSIIVPAGSMIGKVRVPLLDDDHLEAAERFSIRFTSVVNGKLPVELTKHAVDVMILDNDLPPADQIFRDGFSLTDDPDFLPSCYQPHRPDLTIALESIECDPDKPRQSPLISGNDPETTPPILRGELPGWLTRLLTDVSREWVSFISDPRFQTSDEFLILLNLASSKAPAPFNVILKLGVWTAKWLRTEYPKGDWIDRAAVMEDADGKAPFVKHNRFSERWAREMGTQFLLLFAGNKLNDWFKNAAPGFANFLNSFTKIGEVFDGVGNYIGTGVVTGLEIAADKLSSSFESARKRVFGGYADGSTLFLDMDFNGVRSPGEPSAQTTADGLALGFGTDVADLNRDGILDFTEGQWVSEGGLDTSVGHRFRIPFTAPANFAMITPSSTVISKLINIGAFSRTGAGIRSAETRYLTALGLQDQPLAFYDFVSLAANGDTYAAALYGRETQLYNTIVMISSLLEGNSNGLSFPFVADIVIKDLAYKIADVNTSLDLTNPIVVGNLLLGASVRTGITVTQEQALAAADLIARTNDLIDIQPAIGSRDYVEHVARVHSVAHGELSDLLKSLGSNTITPTELNDSTADLTPRIEQAPPQNVIPVYLGVSEGLVYEGDDGFTEMTFVVMPFGDSSLPFSVQFATRDGTAIAGSDYVHTTGTLTWEPGDTSPRTVTIRILSDRLTESDESLYLVLSNATNSVVASTLGYGLIRNDDLIVHETDSTRPNHLVLSVDDQEFVIQQNDVEIFRGTFRGGATALLKTQSTDVLELLVDGDHSVLSTFNTDGTTTLYVGNHLIRVTGNPTIDTPFVPDWTGLPRHLFADRRFTIGVGIPSVLNRNSIRYEWGIFDRQQNRIIQSSTNPNFAFTPTTAGSYVLMLTLSDGVRELVGERELTILPANIAPNAAPDAASTTENRSVRVNVIANDSDIDTTQRLSLVPGSAKFLSMIRDRDGRAVTLASSRLTQSGNSLLFDPGTDFDFLTRGETAKVTIRYSVVDNYTTPLRSDGLVTITVNGTNDAPTIMIDRPTISTLEGSQVSNTGTFADLDLTDSVTLSASLGTITRLPNGRWNWAYTSNDELLNTTVTITATDSNGARTTASFQLVTTNVAPTVTIAGLPTSPVEGSPIRLNGVVVDPGSQDQHSYRWQVIHDGTTVAEGTGLSFEFTPLNDGAYTVTFHATDSASATDSVTSVINVQNSAPLVRITNAPVAAPEGVPITLNSEVLDPSPADFYQYQWRVTRNGMLIADGSTRDFSFIPDRPGNYEVSLSVSDLSDPDAGGVLTSATIQVTPVHQNSQSLFTVTGPSGETIVLDSVGTIISSTPGIGGLGGSASLADFTGDLRPDVILGSGEGVRGTLTVMDGETNTPVWSTSIFESSYTLGVFVASADVTRDGIADIAVSAFDGGGGRVTLFEGKTGNIIVDFFGIDDVNFRGGARVTFGDVNGDGWIDLLVAAGTGGGPRIAIFDGSTLLTGFPKRLISDFFVFEPTLRNGVFAAAGDVNGDGAADLIFGGGPGGGPRVMIWDAVSLLESGPQGSTTLANFFADQSALQTGALVSVKELDGDSLADVVVGVSDEVNSVVRTYFGKELTVDDTPLMGLELDLPQNRVYVG